MPEMSAVSFGNANGAAQLLTIDSADRTSGSATDFIMQLPAMLQNVRSIRLAAVFAANTGYNVPEGYNRMLLTFQQPNLVEVDQLVEIPAGDYDAAGLAAAVQAELVDMAVAFDTVSRKFTLSSTIGREFKVRTAVAGRALPFVLGFSRTYAPSYALEHRGDSVYRGDGVYRRMHVTSSLVADGVLGVFAAPGAQYEAIAAQFPAVDQRVTRSFFQDVDIQLRDEFGAPIANNNSDWLLQIFVQ